MQALTTARLRLRPLTEDDAPFILRLLNEPSFLRFIGDKQVRTVEDAQGYLRSGPLASYQTHGHGLLAVIRAETGELLGMCGLLKRDHLEAPDLGYAYVPETWGQGFAKEAAEAVLAQAEKGLGHDRILALVSPDNDRSIALLKKLGFVFARFLGTDDAPTHLYERTRPAI